MGAYATPPGDINTFVLASGMPVVEAPKNMIWNKELTIYDRAGKSSTRTVAMQQRFFRTIPARFPSDSQNAGV